MITLRIPAGSLALLLLGAGSAQAAEFCVSDGAELDAALLVAESNGQSDVIRMRTGTYTFPGGGTFAYNPAVNSGEIFNIEISGGWTPFFDNPCGQQFATDAFSTVITTGGNGRLLYMELPISNAGTKMTLRRITFLGGNVSVGRGGGVAMIVLASGHTGTLLVDQCAFLNNTAPEAAALTMESFGGTVRLSNSLFRENHSTVNHPVNLYALEGVGIYATNNTIVDNTTDGSFGGLYVRTNGSGTQALVANNNMWGNDGADLNLAGTNTILRNNNIQTRTGATPAEDTNNISVIPFYEPGGLINYTPALGSPLRDGGRQPSIFVPIPPRFEDGWTVGALDIQSHDRVRGPQIDIGAYEGEDINLFSDGFE